jgi:hypothetical protein
MKKGIAIVLFLGLLGCSNGISQKDLPYLNGYWEISKVEFPDGSHKEYPVNTTVDHIVLKGLEGSRKKARPQFDGTYTTNDGSQSFTIYKKEGGFGIHYKNDLNEWHERLEQLSENGFSVVNEEGITYHYKRYQPINVSSDGEKKK